MQPKHEHAVVVCFHYKSKELDDLLVVQGELEKAILAADVGELDGNEIALDGSEAYFFMYGPDADALFGVIKPILEKTSFMHGANVKLQYGAPQNSPRRKTIVIDPCPPANC